jgi:hypothetical protein
LALLLLFGGDYVDWIFVVFPLWVLLIELGAMSVSGKIRKCLLWTIDEVIRALSEF